MPELLLELFSEEIPARMQRKAAEDLKKAVTNALVDAGLVYESAKAFVTPRRLALKLATECRTAEAGRLDRTSILLFEQLLMGLSSAIADRYFNSEKLMGLLHLFGGVLLLMVSAFLASFSGLYFTVVLVTDGAAPMRWWTRTRAGTADTFTVETIDTTAAGDASVAGLLQRLVARGIDADGLAAAFEDDAVREDLLRHAAAAGALATTRHGAFDAMPDAAAVQALLETAR